jgi:hypothetical protein
LGRPASRIRGGRGCGLGEDGEDDADGEDAEDDLDGLPVEALELRDAIAEDQGLDG